MREWKAALWCMAVVVPFAGAQDLLQEFTEISAADPEFLKVERGEEGASRWAKPVVSHPVNAHTPSTEPQAQQPPKGFFVDPKPLVETDVTLPQPPPSLNAIKHEEGHAQSSGFWGNNKGHGDAHAHAKHTPADEKDVRAYVKVGDLPRPPVQPPPSPMGYFTPKTLEVPTPGVSLRGSGSATEAGEAVTNTAPHTRTDVNELVTEGGTMPWMQRGSRHLQQLRSFIDTLQAEVRGRAPRQGKTNTRMWTGGAAA